MLFRTSILHCFKHERIRDVEVSHECHSVKRTAYQIIAYQKKKREKILFAIMNLFMLLYRVIGILLLFVNWVRNVQVVRRWPMFYFQKCPYFETQLGSSSELIWLHYWRQTEVVAIKTITLFNTRIVYRKQTMAM